MFARDAFAREAWRFAPRVVVGQVDNLRTTERVRRSVGRSRATPGPDRSHRLFGFGFALSVLM